MTIPITARVTGLKKNIVFTFSGTADATTGNMVNIDWWKFNTEEETAISNIRTERPQDNATYDLSGRKTEANKLQKGIYIKNGRKVLVR